MIETFLIKPRATDALEYGRPFRTALFVVVALFLSGAAAEAQQSEATALTERARTLIFTDAAEAEKLLKRALELHENSLGLHHKALAPVLKSLGWLYDWKLRYAEAEEVESEQPKGHQERPVLPAARQARQQRPGAGADPFPTARKELEQMFGARNEDIVLDNLVAAVQLHIADTAPSRNFSAYATISLVAGARLAAASIVFPLMATGH